MQWNIKKEEIVKVENNKIVNRNPTISINTGNGNTLNILIKVQRLSDWIKKQDCLQKTHIKYKDLDKLKVRRWKEISCKH